METNIQTSVFDELHAEQSYYEYATTGQRLGNYLIDLVIFYLFNFAIFFCLGICMRLSGMDIYDIRQVASWWVFKFGVSYLDHFIIYSLIEGITKGRSIGKLITRTQAVDAGSFSPITWKQALLRSLCRSIPFEVFSGLGNTPWHDSLSKTTVIRKIPVDQF